MPNNVFFNDIVPAPTRNQQYLAFLDSCRKVGINVNRIGTTSLINLLAQAQIRGTSVLWQVLSLMGANLTNIYNASGLWLDLIATGFYDCPRSTQSAAIGNLWIDILQSGVTNITLTNPATGVVYTGKWDGSVPGTGNAFIQLTANTLGEIGNCNASVFTSNPIRSSGSPTNYQVNTSLNNSGLTWISNGGSFGTELETDDQLRNRCLAVIAQKALGSYQDNIYSYIINQSGYQATRILYSKTPNSGQSIYYIAGSNGPCDQTLFQATNGTNSILQTLVQNFTGAETFAVASPAYQLDIVIGGSLIFKKGITLQIMNQYLNAMVNFLQTRPIMNPIDSSTFLHIYDVYEFLDNINGSGSLVAPSINFTTNNGIYLINTDITAPLPFQSYAIYNVKIDPNFQLINLPK